MEEPNKSRFLPPEVRLLLFALALGGIAATLLALGSALLMIVTGLSGRQSIDPWRDSQEHLLLSLTVQYIISYLPYTVLSASFCVAAFAVMRRMGKSTRLIQGELASGLDRVAAALQGNPGSGSSPASSAAVPARDVSPLKELGLELEPRKLPN